MQIVTNGQLSSRTELTGNIRADNIEKEIEFTKEDLCFNLRKYANIISRYYNKCLKPTGITVTQLYTLIFIQNEFVNLRELSSILGCDRTTTSRCIENLKKLEFIIKSDKKMRKGSYYDITEKGKICVTKSILLISSAKKDIIYIVGQEMYDETIKILNKIGGIVWNLERSDLGG